MSVEKVREYLKPYGVADRMREFEVSSATVELAAKVVGVEPGRIAKSMSFKLGEEAIVIVMAGDARVDNARYKARFHAKAKMLRFRVLPSGQVVSWLWRREQAASVGMPAASSRWTTRYTKVHSP